MAFAEVERLVTDLLGTGAMRDDTAADLHRFLAEARAGQLHLDDLAYIRGLHSRLVGTKPAGGGSSSPHDGPKVDNPVSVLDQLKSANATVAALRQKLALAQKTILELEHKLANAASEDRGDDRKFQDIKKRFAKRYHPNAIGTTGMEAAVRAEVFKEFWAEIADVEKS